MIRVVKPDELGRPDEKLMKLMKKLELSPQKGKNTLTYSSCTHKTYSLLYDVHCVMGLQCTPTRKDMYGAYTTHLSGGVLLLGVE